MEALSLVGGIIAVAQGGDRVIELLKKLRPLFDAPKGIDLLIDEISAFKSILADLQNTLDHISSLQIKGQIGYSNISNNLQQARDVLAELEHLVEHSFVKSQAVKTDGSRKISRVAWTRKLHEVEHLRGRLRDIKMNILVQLGGIQTIGHVHLSQSIDGIAHSVAARLSEHSNIQQSIMRHFEVMSVQMAALLNNDTEKDTGNDVDTDAVGSISSAAGDDSSLINSNTSPFQLPGMSAQLSSLCALKLRVQHHYRCSRSCPCLCHKKSQLETPSAISNFTGSFKISWPMSYNKDVCDHRSCRSRSRSLFDLECRFPRWLLTRILYLSCVLSRQNTPEFLIRILRSRPFSSEIFISVRVGNVDRVHQLLSTGQASVFDVDDEDQQSLLATSLVNPVNVNMARYLLLSGADVFQEESNGRSPFDMIWTDMLSQNDTQTDFYQQLRPLVPDIGSSDMKFTTLHGIILGFHGGDLEIELHAHSLDVVNAKDVWGRTALMWASVRGDIRSVLLLLRAGADPNVSDNFETPLAATLDSGQVGCAYILLRYGADATKYWGQNPLHNFASSFISDDKIPESPDFGDRSVWTEVKAFLEKPNLEEAFLDELLRLGVDINARTSQGSSALIGAVRTNKPRLINAFLRKGADFLNPNINGRTILHYAAGYGDVKCLKVLRSHKLRGVGINIRDANGEIALDWVEERTDVDDEWLQAWQELVESIMAADRETDEIDTEEDEIFEDALEEIEEFL